MQCGVATSVVSSQPQYRFIDHNVALYQSIATLLFSHFSLYLGLVLCHDGGYLEARMIKAIVFDIGGVLEITPPTGWIEGWEQRLGLAAGSINQQLHDLWLGGSIGTVSEQAVEAGIAERLGLDATQLATFLADLWAEYLGTLNHELLEFFASLRPRYTTAILSNSFVGARQREQAAYGFEDVCDLIIYSHEEGLKKPDPAFYRLACERLNIEPHEMIFLDDIEVVVEAARDFGINAILYRSNQQAIAEIQALLVAG